MAAPIEKLVFNGSYLSTDSKGEKMSSKTIPEGAVEIDPKIYWIGFYDAQSGLHCNPYLIIDEDEAIVIDSGSRPDFPVVMMKLLQTGIAPQQIGALIYQHYDPDLCGSIPNFEDIIQRKDLKIISASENLMFIRHYSITSHLYPLSKLNFQYEFSSGRKLQFIPTPYAHSGGSFITFDEKSRILFTSDLLGSYGTQWELFLNLRQECMECLDLSDCPQKRLRCPVRDILNFHRTIMPSAKALKYALETILKVPFAAIAPQHGSIIKDKKILRFVFEQLISLDKVGIDSLISKNYHFNFGNLKKRFKTS
jgi:flavorubredoxin